MTVRYAVTWEFPLRPPITYRGTVSATQPEACCRLATKEARKALRPQGWSSMVCVLLERLDVTPDAVEPEETDDALAVEA